MVDPTFPIGIDDVEGLDPRLLYFGKSYSDYATDWFNWFLSAHSDNRNLGPVVFLRSKHIPDRPDQVYDLQVSNYPTTTAGTMSENPYGYPTLYVNEPNIRVGSERLQIFEDQAVFVPIIVAYAYSNHAYKDWGYMQEYVGMTIDNGDNPPALNQLEIDNKPISLPDDLGKDFTNFRISTPVFTAVVPEAPYGTSIKDFLEEGPISPGSYPAMIAGYFIMLKFKAREGKSYWVHAVASAGREVRGPYFSELLYQIDVHQRPQPHGRISLTGVRPASFQEKAREILNRLKGNFPSSDNENTIEGFKENWSHLGPDVVITPDSLKMKDKK